MVRIGSLKNDPQKAEEGVWCDFEGIRLRIASLGSPRFQNAYAEATDPHRARMRAGSMPEDDLQKLHKQLVAKHILLDWENLEDDAGNPIPYSPEKALEFFDDPELVDFFNFVWTTSLERQRYRRTLLEDARGNSRTTSAGKSNGVKPR